MIDNRDKKLVSALLRGDKDSALSILTESMIEQSIKMESGIIESLVNEVNGVVKDEQDSII
jgi:hypothetical protein